MKRLYNKVSMYLWEIVVNRIISSSIMPLLFRQKFYQLLGMNINTRYIHSNVYFGSKNIEIGSKRTFINKGCFFDNQGGGKIKIGDNCAVSYDVMFCTSTHEVGLPTRRSGKTQINNIDVGDGCWIGARVLILPGVTIETGCIIAAGSVVTQDCKANGLYAGVPAVRKKNLSI